MRARSVEIAAAALRKAGDLFSRKSKWRVLRGRARIHLYAGNVPVSENYRNVVGLSLWKKDERHIRHDVRRRMGLPDDSIDVYQAEDVFEHIAYDRLLAVVNDIHRVLKPGGIFRLSLPDYRCDILAARCLKNERGEILFDPSGGGFFKGAKIGGGGHLWFPRYETVRDLLQRSRFRDSFTFYHCYLESGKALLQDIDYANGYVKRTPDHDPRVGNPARPMSIVVDAVKIE